MSLNLLMNLLMHPQLGQKDCQIDKSKTLSIKNCMGGMVYH